MLRQFFRFARNRKLILADPTRGLAAAAPRGFTGQTIALDQQRDLFRRWTTSPYAHPHEALLGILALLHGASSSEVRHLRVSDIDADGQDDPARQPPAPGAARPGELAGLQRCLAHREQPAHRQPARDRHQGHQGRAGARIRPPM